MIPIVVTVTLAAADDDGVAQNQTPGAAGDLTLNGALVVAGVGVLATVPSPIERQVLITTASNESAKTLTVYGTNAGGSPISETVTGPNATTGVTVQYFQTVTRVAVSAAFTGNVKVGTNGVGGSRAIYLDQFAGPTTAVQVDVTGTVNYTLQYTQDNLETVGSSVNWFDWTDSALVAATASKASTTTIAPRYLREKINSGTGTATLTVRQIRY